MSFNGLGGIATLVAATMSILFDLMEFSVKQRIFQGANTIGHIAVAIAGMSLLMKRMNLSFF